MQVQLEKYKKFAPAILRIGMSLVFLWFGTQQLLHAGMWTSFVPEWVLALSPFDATILVHFNGGFEVVFGTLLIIGFYTRISAFLLTLHMFHIALTVGYNAIGIRDFGLTIATLSIFLNDIDFLTIDYGTEKRKQSFPIY